MIVDMVSKHTIFIVFSGKDSLERWTIMTTKVFISCTKAKSRFYSVTTLWSTVSKEAMIAVVIAIAQ